MRALSGAIITAAALIAMGLTAQGIGTRYAGIVQLKSSAAEQPTSSKITSSPDYVGPHVTIHDMDNGLKLSLTLSILAMLIGLGITFVGLMYHHHRRFHEHLRLHGQPGATTGHHVTS